MKRLRLLPIALVPAVVLGLAACAGSGSDSSTASASASPTPAAITSCPKPGKASDAVRVSGDFAGSSAPKVTFTKGTKATPPQSTTLTKGTGAKLKDGGYAEVAYSAYDAKTGKELTAVGYGGDPQLLSVGSDGFGSVLKCSRVGDRVVTVGAGSSLSFPSVTDQVVLVADVVRDNPGYSTGATQTQDPALPTVKDKKDGEPEITIPDGYKAPSKTTTEVLKAGDGSTLTADDSVFVQYKGEVIASGKVFDSTWERGEPTTFSLSGVVAGFKDGLVGQKVGSQVLIIMPADQAYGANPPEGSDIPANADLLFVVDILAKG